MNIITIPYQFQNLQKINWSIPISEAYIGTTLECLTIPGVPDSLRVSGNVSHKGTIIGKKATYVILSRHVSGQDKSRG
jgi:hypothetical protein